LIHIFVSEAFAKKHNLPSIDFKETVLMEMELSKAIHSRIRLHDKKTSDIFDCFIVTIEDDIILGTPSFGNFF
jgi:hypothetical protein